MLYCSDKLDTIFTIGGRFEWFVIMNLGLKIYIHVHILIIVFLVHMTILGANSPLYTIPNHTSHLRFFNKLHYTGYLLTNTVQLIPYHTESSWNIYISERADCLSDFGDVKHTTKSRFKHWIQIANYMYFYAFFSIFDTCDPIATGADPMHGNYRKRIDACFPIVTVFLRLFTIDLWDSQWYLFR